MLLWLLATIALAVAVPGVWAQRNIIDANGYTGMAQKAATDPQLRAAVAEELANKATALISEHGSRVDAARVHGVASAYTAGPSFPSQFAQANRIAHSWAFAGTQSGPDPWVVDLAPMLNDTAFRQMLADYDVYLPATVTVPLTVSAPKALRPGELHPLTTWGAWVSLAATVLTGTFAVLTLAAARSRGRALASLGVSALMVGAVGYAGIEVARRHIDDALDHASGDVRRVADAMVGYAEGSLHHWLDLTLVAGGALVVFGALTAMVGGLRRA